ncbi:MAG: transcription termination/antitermination protein NusA, partial [Acidobacteria bacterium]|nr:transcription termination/antitermination protein NusA [Acidobacteriota bacterium]
PVGACVGMKGSRVQSIIRELRGEKIDIIEFSDDLVTFAQSALAPAKITRVSVTHHGEVPHLDVIVEDEQLSLAIGKRGQNVRLAAELIGAKIDIKSETDVKDEVADALARMLQGVVSQSGPRQADVEIDLTEIPGVGAKTAEALQATGLGTLNALLEASAEDLTEVEGVGPKLAETIMSWARDEEDRLRQEADTASVAEGFEVVEEPSTPTMADDDFMAALSRAFQESEALQARLADNPLADEGEPEADAESTDTASEHDE